MSDNRGITGLIVLCVVGIAIIGVLGYALYDGMNGPQPATDNPTQQPTAVDGANTTPLPPAPSATPATPTAVSIPAPTIPQPTSCVDDMRLVLHLTHDPQNPDHLNALRRNKRFTKGWRIRNTGTCLWDPGYSIVYESGNHAAAEMHGAMVVTHGRTAPGEIYDIEVRLIAPSEPGDYEANWRMRNAAGTYFGDRLPVAISVRAPTTPPTWTPRPVTTIQFNSDRDRLARGECALFTWNVSNAQAAYLYQGDQAWQAHGVPFIGQHTACPTETTNYYLRVVRHSGWVDVRRLVVHVVQPIEAPQIASFTVEPEVLSAGECVTARWEVRGHVTRVRLFRAGELWWEDAPTIANLYDCPPGTGQIDYRLEATGPGGTTSTQRAVYVDVTPTATPEPLSGTAWQVLAIGNSVPVGSPLTVLLQGNAAGQGTVSGWGGCNDYSAAYQQNGSLLSIGSPVVGGNVCTAEIAAQEQALLEALQATASFGRSGGQLVLRNSGGEVVLNLTAIQVSAP